jgi:hypothetical protein
MGSASAIGGRCNPALAPTLFCDAVNNSRDEDWRAVLCGAPVFGTIAGEHHEFASQTKFDLSEDPMLAAASDRASQRRVGSTGKLPG